MYFSFSIQAKKLWKIGKVTVKKELEIQFRHKCLMINTWTYLNYSILSRWERLLNYQPAFSEALISFNLRASFYTALWIEFYLINIDLIREISPLTGEMNRKNSQPLINNILVTSFFPYFSGYSLYTELHNSWMYFVGFYPQLIQKFSQFREQRLYKYAQSIYNIDPWGWLADCFQI